MSKQEAVESNKADSLQQERSSTTKTINNKQPSENNADSGYDQPSSLVLLTLVIFIFSQIAIAIVLAVIMLTTGQNEDFFEQVMDSSINSFLIIAAMTIIQFAGIYLVMKRLIKRPLSSIGLVKPLPIDFNRGVVAWVIYMAAIIIVLGILGAIDTGIDMQQEQQIDFQPSPDLLSRTLVYLSIVVAPAFIEEVLMRGFLFMNLRRRLNFVTSTLIVSVIFGIAHLQFGSGEPLLWVAFVDTFVLSVVLCGLTEKYKTVWPAVFAHAIKNSLAFYLLFVREG